MASALNANSSSSLSTSQAVAFDLTNYKLSFTNLVTSLTVLIPDLSAIVSDYLIGPVMPYRAQELEQIYGIGTEQLYLGPDFYAWWWSQDAHDLMIAKDKPTHPIRLNCETHWPPVLRPRCITHLATKTLQALTLESLEHLAKNPQDGRFPSRYTYQSKALVQNSKTEAGPASYIVMRKEVFARNKSTVEQIHFMRKLNAKFGAEWEEENSALDVAFVLFTIHASTGLRCLGDSTGFEGRLTASRCSKNTFEQCAKKTRSFCCFSVETDERIEKKYPLAVGSFSVADFNGDDSSGGLIVGSLEQLESGNDMGIAAVRKFPAHPRTLQLRSSSPESVTQT